MVLLYRSTSLSLNPIIDVMMAQLSLEWKCLLSAKPTHRETRGVRCQPSCSKGPTFYKNLNWSVKHQTVITCGEPGEICKHPVCGVSLRLLLCVFPPSSHQNKTTCWFQSRFSLQWRKTQNESCKFRSLNLLLGTVTVWTLTTMDEILNMYTCATVAVCSFFRSQFKTRIPV